MCIFAGIVGLRDHVAAMNRFQKLAAAALVSLLLLIFVGAIVRVTGAGMGCPDWPTCWGCLIPPTSVEQVNFDQLPIDVFKSKAARMGRDPSDITQQNLRAEFNPQHVWTEFINRLCTMPVGILSLATFIAAFAQRRARPWVLVMAFAGLLVVLINAWMGRNVVYSGLKPGVLTAHLALAMALTGILVFCAWGGCAKPWRIQMPVKPLARSRRLVTALLILVVIEGILGAQVRELTDEMAKGHDHSPQAANRSSWIDQLESSGLYLVHRSGSWLIFFWASYCWWHSKRHTTGGRQHWSEHGIIAIVWMQMLLGVTMSQIHIYAWVQVLHVGFAAILLSLLWLWRFGLSAPNYPAQDHQSL